MKSHGKTHIHSLLSGLTLLAATCLAAPRRASAAPIQYGGFKVELSISQISDKTLRIQLSPIDDQGKAEAPAASPMLLPLTGTELTRVRDETGTSGVKTRTHYSVTVQSSPLVISVNRPDGSLVQELTFDDTNNAITFRTAGSVLGLGEGADQFDRRGTNYTLRNGQGRDLAELGTRIFSPFLIGTEGWAMFIGTPSGSVDLRDNNGVFHPRNGTPTGVDIFVTDAQQPADAMREFIRLTGSPAMPPKWALGYMQSHRTLTTEADILAEAKKFRDDDLPCDTFIFLGTGFCPAGWNFAHDSFQFNTNVFTDDAATVLKDLHDDHIHVILHIVPLQRDYPSLHGSIPPAPDEDVNKTDIGSYWKRHDDLMADGVDGWWPDEGDWFDVPSRLARHRMYYEGPLSVRPNVRPWDLQRNGCPGISQYGGWVWSGDISSSWKTFAAQVEVGQNSSLSVSPYWGTDTGGFYPAADREYTGELYTRWFQFSTFCPSFRSHGRTWRLHEPWGWNTGETGFVESRPAPDPSELHNAAVEPICRQYLDLRYQLLPYNYTLAREASDTGLPFMRALWLHYPTDPEAVKLGSEYLWGRDLLIAPVTEKGATSRRVYLPAGVWYDWWNNSRLVDQIQNQNGGTWVDRPVDLATMPIYVRAGAIIPLDPVRQFTAQDVTGPTTIRVYPGADGDFTLYDDDGNSLGYRDGSDPKTVWIHFHWDDAKHRLTAEPDARMKQWPGGVRSFAVEAVGSSGKPTSLEFRGSATSVAL
jgi:alpha-glucosidase (family GH31 glycosyl hydrolase)